jgi:hypothetical protein
MIQPIPPTRIEYQGGDPIFPGMEVFKVQPVLIDEVGDRGAIFLQKVHDWTLYNKPRGNHEHDGMTWTYNSYADWFRKHFPFWSKSWFATNVPILEEKGFLISTQDAPFCKKGEKAYRLNYDKLLSLAAYAKKEQGVIKKSTPPTTNDNDGYDKVAHNNIVKQEKQSGS